MAKIQWRKAEKRASQHPRNRKEDNQGGESKIQVDGDRTSEQSLNTINEKQIKQGESSHWKQLENETQVELVEQRSANLRNSSMNKFGGIP